MRVVDGSCWYMRGGAKQEEVRFCGRATRGVIRPGPPRPKRWGGFCPGPPIQVEVVPDVPTNQPLLLGRGLGLANPPPCSPVPGDGLVLRFNRYRPKCALVRVRTGLALLGAGGCLGSGLSGHDPPCRATPRDARIRAPPSAPAHVRGFGPPSRVDSFCGEYSRTPQSSPGFPAARCGWVPCA